MTNPDTLRDEAELKHFKTNMRHTYSALDFKAGWDAAVEHLMKPQSTGTFPEAEFNKVEATYQSHGFAYSSKTEAFVEGARQGFERGRESVAGELNEKYRAGTRSFAKTIKELTEKLAAAERRIEELTEPMIHSKSEMKRIAIMSPHSAADELEKYKKRIVELEALNAKYKAALEKIADPKVLRTVKHPNGQTISVYPDAREQAGIALARIREAQKLVEPVSELPAETAR